MPAILQSTQEVRLSYPSASSALSSHVPVPSQSGGRPLGTLTVFLLRGSPLWRCCLKFKLHSMLWMTAITNHGTVLVFETASYRALFFRIASTTSCTGKGLVMIQVLKRFTYSGRRSERLGALIKVQMG